MLFMILLMFFAILQYSSFNFLLYSPGYKYEHPAKYCQVTLYLLQTL